MLPGRLLEANSNVRRRGMIAAVSSRKQGTEQNSAYESLRRSAAVPGNEGRPSCFQTQETRYPSRVSVHFVGIGCTYARRDTSSTIPRITPFIAFLQ